MVVWLWGVMDAHTLLLPVPAQSLPSCVLGLTPWLASEKPHFKNNN